MDKLDHLLDARIRELRKEAPLLLNEQELTDRVMDYIQTHRRTSLLHRNWVRLVLNSAAVGLIACFIIQSGKQGPSSVTGSRSATSEFVIESQVGKHLRQTTANEALPTYLGFLQQRTRENKAFRSSRPTSKTLAL